MKNTCEMKDSGVEWIGKIPRGWEICQLKRCLEAIKDGTHGTFERVASGNLLLSAKNVFEDGIHLGDNESQISETDFNSIVSNGFPRKNDVLMCIVGTVGRACLYQEDKPMAFQRSVAFLRCNFLLMPNYLRFILASPSTAEEEMLSSNGTAQVGLYLRDILKLSIVLPPLPEQVAIASYLDDKCGAIDSIIAETKSTIEEYKRWRASVIFEAVTKGLEKNAEMKDSGVDWIGKIPKGWETTRLKYHANLMPKCNFEHLCDDSLITFTPMECIRHGYFENRTCHYGDFKGSYTQYANGDIVIAKVTPCFENGNCAIMEHLHSGVGLGSSELFVLRPFSISQKYLFYFLQMPGFVEMGCSTMTGTGGLKRVSSDAVANSPLPLPPLSEQSAIADYLDSKCGAIDGIIEEKERLISELEAYRKSLIFEVVTGKRRVCQ